MPEEYKKYLGGSFEDFLKEEGIYEEWKRFADRKRKYFNTQRFEAEFWNWKLKYYELKETTDPTPEEKECDHVYGSYVDCVNDELTKFRFNFCPRCGEILGEEEDNDR